MFQSVLIIKLSSVGDVVMATPVVRHLKSLFQARIVWAIDEGIAPLLQGHPDIDDLLLFPRDPFRPFALNLPALAPKLGLMLRKLRGQSFDLAIDLQGRGRSYAILQLSRAQMKVGRGRFPFLKHTVAHRRDVARHAVESYFEAIDILGLPRPQDARIVLPEFPDDRQRVRCVLSKSKIDSGFVCVAPGASWPSKRWPLQYWAQVIDWLLSQDQQVVLVGSAGEAGLGRELASRASFPERIISLFGAFTLRELISVFKLSRLCLAADTGPLHIAAASGAPVIALFGASDPVRTAPWPAGTAEIVTAPDCRHCRLPRCAKGCMSKLPPGAVIAKAAGILQQTQASFKA
ncbi:MAG TPA: glycosyltransferase family 9 protein [Acidobacteriota bacterium]